MATITKNIHRAACVAALYELDRAGYLNDLTLQEIADLLDVGHRSTAMRYMRDVEEIKELVPEVKTKLRHAPPLKP
jgi:predicted DNA-binding protein YlxM (UPF0122 family)